MLKFLRNMRIKSQLNDAEQEFKALSGSDRAYAVLMAAEFIIDLEKANVSCVNILLKPYAFLPEQCYQVYWDTEALKLYAEKSIRNSRNLLREWGVPDEKKDHAQLKYAGLIYWMVRVAMNVDKDLYARARDVSKVLVHGVRSRDFDEAVERLNEVVAMGESMGQAALSCNVIALRKRAEELVKDHG